MSLTHNVLAILFCGGTAVLAQSIYFPSTMTNVSNGSSYAYNFPFAYGISRIMIVYEDWDLALAPNTPITRIGFRQDGAQTSVSRLVQLEVRMGTTSATGTTVNSTFDSNYTSSPAIVHPQALFTLPALNAANAGSIVWVNLTTPYVYPGGNLLVEFRILGNNNGNQSFYYPLDLTDFVSTVTSGTQGCLNSGGLRASLTSSPTAIGGTWYLSLNSAPANTAVALFVAPGQQLPAPFSLGILGLDPTCMGQIPANFASFSASSNSGGAVAWTVAVPNSLAFYGYHITSQALAFDFFVPGNLVTSNAVDVQFGARPAEAMLYSQGSATATTGSVAQNYGLVTLFN